MKVEQHGEFRTAVFGRTVTEDDLAEVAAADVEGAALLGNDPRMDVQRSIDVLAEGPSLRSLSVAWVKAVPTVPVAILRSVEHLSLAGRVGRTRLRPEAMPRLRSLDTPAALIDGPLDACASLEAVALDRFAAPDLGILNGCQALRHVKINGRRTELAFGWDTPPSHLQEMHLFSLFPTSLGQVPGRGVAGDPSV